MNDPGPRFRELFFAVYEHLPRQGPGSRACAERALQLCAGLPRTAAIADLGCGAGAQTLHLAELTEGPIIAVDAHGPSIQRLQAALEARGLVPRVHARVGDMAALDLPRESFDLVWSEGALYNLGLERALRVCHGLLRPGGHLAFTDAVWLVPDPPQEAKAMFEVEYPSMGAVPRVLEAVRRQGFELLGHFTLPDEAWWDDFYTPMEERIRELREKHRDEAEALTILDELAREPALHRHHGDSYAYEFFVARRLWHA